MTRLRASSGKMSASTGIPAFGTVLAGKYRVESLLGAGGMGVVVAATHLHLQERVAVKLLHPEMAKRANAVERFLREARVAMRLRGEHVVRVLDVGIDGDTPYLVMECLEGNDLGTVVRDATRLPVDSAVDYVLQACEAIAEAHVFGVVHRDLKPANLFLTRRVDGSPCIKVLDFGVSKFVEAGPLEDLDATAPPSMRMPGEDPVDLGVATTVGVERDGVTRTRTMLGSPRYMAPEQLRSARDVDARADLWAIGVILYELLSGKPPFTEDSLDALSVAIRERDVPPLQDVPPALADVVLRCLAKDREARWSDAPSLAAALLPFASAEGRTSADRIARMMRHLGEKGRTTRLGATGIATAPVTSIPPSGATPDPLASTPRSAVGVDSASGAQSLPAQSRTRRMPWVAVVAVAVMAPPAAFFAMRARQPLAPPAETLTAAQGPSALPSSLLAQIPAMQVPVVPPRESIAEVPSAPPMPSAKAAPSAPAIPSSRPRSRPQAAKHAASNEAHDPPAPIPPPAAIAPVTPVATPAASATEGDEGPLRIQKDQERLFNVRK